MRPEGLDTPWVPAIWEANLSIANRTAGDTSYFGETEGVDGDIVKVKLFLQNMELPDSGKWVHDVEALLSYSGEVAQTQVVFASATSRNSPTIDDIITVRHSTDAMFVLIPVDGSVRVRRLDSEGDPFDYQANESFLDGEGGLQLGDISPFTGPDLDRVWVTAEFRIDVQS